MAFRFLMITLIFVTCKGNAGERTPTYEECMESAIADGYSSSEAEYYCGPLMDNAEELSGELDENAEDILPPEIRDLLGLKPLQKREIIQFADIISNTNFTLTAQKIGIVTIAAILLKQLFVGRFQITKFYALTPPFYPQSASSLDLELQDVESSLSEIISFANRLKKCDSEDEFDQLIASSLSDTVVDFLKVREEFSSKLQLHHRHFCRQYQDCI